MASTISTSDLVQALSDASRAHHEYETNALKGHRDERWSGWYAGYVLGRLGDFTTPTQLAQCLEQVDDNEDWNLSAAQRVIHTLTSNT